MDKNFKIRLCIGSIYVVLLGVFFVPILLCFMNYPEQMKIYKVMVPSIAAVLVAWLQKSASKTMEQRASFATPGLHELRVRYQRHVDFLEKIWLVLAIYAVIIAVL